jgi:DNA-binding SARP family transcriptional activator/tetratricopeptide (TPR) repeat protein
MRTGVHCMDFRMLGVLEVESSGGRLPLGPSEQKVLAVLLLEADRIVPVVRLVDVLWDDNAPATAVKQVQNTVGRLRRALTSAGEADPVQTQRSGYRIRLMGNTLDTREFETKVRRAEEAASTGHVIEATALLESALSLWRGRALDGLTGRLVDAAADAWEEKRWMVQESYYDHRLALGQHGGIVSELRALVSAHPLRERPVALLMLALYRCGRRAEALEAYATARTTLAVELGLDPDQELQWLHQQILTGAPGLDIPSSGGTGRLQDVGPRWLPVPRQLPAAPRNFVGRRAELTLMSSRLNKAGGTVVISAIGGTAGVGKTALAVHWAHVVAEHFPDGQLYVNLRGFDLSEVPTSPEEAVRGFLAALNVPAERVPANLDEQVAMYRSLLAGKKFLIIADNARDSAQVRPLLPGSPGCLVVVTSRSHLMGLVASDGAHMVGLGLLSQDEARQFLADRIGHERLAAEPRSADELIGVCARLPLALSIAACQAAANPARPLAVRAAELRDAKNRLDVLAADDISVRAAFSWSYGQLSDPAARMFRLLGLHPGPDLSLPAAASLGGLCVEEARQVLAELARMCLLEEDHSGRFSFHDLLRVYAAERVRADETAVGRDMATHRLLDHYLHTAYAAARLLHPAREPIELDPAQPGTMPEHLADREEALSWFDTEHRILRAAIAVAASTGFPRHSWQTAWTLANYLSRRGHLLAGRDVQQMALDAAQKADDLTGQAHAHILLGRAEVWLSRHDDAREHLREALTLFQSLGDHAACARAYLDLGWAADQQGRHADAAAPMRQALAMYRSIRHEVGEAHTLSYFGWHYAILGNYQRAIACCKEALTLHRAHGNVVVRAATTDTLGYIHYLLGDYPSAVEFYEQAIAQLDKLGSRHNAALSMCRLGEAHLAADNPPAAREAWKKAAAIFDELGHPDAIATRGKVDAL